MKKSIADDKKLKLAKRTIRVLSEDKLSDVAGGMTSTVVCRTFWCLTTSG